MNWFNPFGLIFVAVIMIPNIIFAVKCKNRKSRKFHDREISGIVFIPIRQVHTLT